KELARRCPYKALLGHHFRSCRAAKQSLGHQVFRCFPPSLLDRVLMVHIDGLNTAAYDAPVRTGLVGCGRLAQLGYLPAFRRASAVKLVGVADVNQARCGEIAPEVPSYPNIQALIEAAQLEAVIISPPTRFHLSNAISAAQAGLPTLVEKPPGRTADEARILSGLKPSPWIGLNRRFDPIYLE